MIKLCSIFFYEGYVGIAPTIINLAKILDINNYQVTICGTENYSPNPGNLGEKVKTIYFKKESSKLFNLFNKLKIKTLGPLVIYAVQCLGYKFRGDRGASHFCIETEGTSPPTPSPKRGGGKAFSPFPLKGCGAGGLGSSYIEMLRGDRSLSPQKSVNIGVDINGGIVAYLYFLLFKQNYLFLSLELTDPRKFKVYTGVGMLAKLAYKNSSCVIVQDRERLKILGEYYEYQHPQVFYLPNSPLNERDLKLDNINYFREKFNLSQEQFPHIVLQAGWIGDEVCSKALAQAFASLNNGCALVFHSSSPKTGDQPYLKLLRQVNSQNLFLSLEPVDYEEIDKIYASSTIGLAFYKDSDPNFSEISMASGKLPQYLKWGKPVLASNLPSLSKLIEQYQCGIIINDPSNSEEIKLAIARLLSDYDNYSINAKACFDAEFNFSQKMQPILDFIDGL